ncbi:uncharacterized protein BO96DRAFT_331351 [Aspergillus niger CBS 101883]|uniref:Uncharacterized protein n=2 Tax=Aspergillus niger TaxID=5061 RepID=A5AAM0_ASPNC|nr:uncharacterized protein BO96DRAFT_331351 [Aspergillus niger CBS 101883]XP_059605260.1 hypothetical protein An04g01665 [Aspergillus niger]PYH59701.1 hypothetical protein BO96DRAFT_331351 [Aspergillus niger CBS 101883]CAK47930.1 hypothetical protein An04g01665 [Aspergillus niger]
MLHRARGTGLGPMVLSRDRALSPSQKSSFPIIDHPCLHRVLAPSHRINPAASRLYSSSLPLGFAAACRREASQRARKSHRRHPSPVTIYHHHSFHPALTLIIPRRGRREAASPPRPASTRSK